MRPSACLAQGFFKRSLDEFKRISNIALTAEGTRTSHTPFPLITFDNKDVLRSCKKMSDADTGGFTKANFDFVPGGGEEPAHARFHGNISIDLPPNRPEIQRTGYAAWRTLDRPPTIFGRSLWNIDPYTYLGLRIKSDGRKYFINVQTESIEPTDIHQHRLYSQRPGEWETVYIKWNEFVRTNFGMVVEPQTEILRQKVRTVGIGLTDRIPGPFDLRIASMWATNDPEQASAAGDIEKQNTIISSEAVSGIESVPENSPGSR